MENNWQKIIKLDDNEGPHKFGLILVKRVLDNNSRISKKYEDIYKISQMHVNP